MSASSFSKYLNVNQIPHKAKTLLNQVVFLVILFVLQMILICQLFHLKYHFFPFIISFFFVLTQCFIIIIIIIFIFIFIPILIFIFFFSTFYFSFSFSFLFLSSWLSDSNFLSVKIISNKSFNKFNNSLCLGV